MRAIMEVPRFLRRLRFMYRSLSNQSRYEATNSISTLTFGAHLIQTYGGLVRLPELSSRGLAPWQQRRATEFLCEHLNGGILLRCWSSSSRIGLLQTPKWRAVCLRQRAMLEGSL
jgi:hypothetical protein